MSSRPWMTRILKVAQECDVAPTRYEYREDKKSRQCNWPESTGPRYFPLQSRSKTPKPETVLASDYLPPKSLPADKSAVGFYPRLVASPIRSIPYREQKLRYSVERGGDEHC